MIEILNALYNPNDELKILPPIEAHEGGRNVVYTCVRFNEPKFVIRVSMIGDRKETEYLAEVEFVRFLAQGGASVANVIPSVNGRLVEKINFDGKEIFISCFEYAKGMLISDNGYRYREGSPLSEYFYNTGRTLGKIHQLSKKYNPTYNRIDYFDKYNNAYIEELIPDDHLNLKIAIKKRFELFRNLPRTSNEYGLVHFDFSDGNYHIDMATGNITVFDFDNCINCWYMYDLANLWVHGVGWYQFECDKEKRRIGMQNYFKIIIEGYRKETEISEKMLEFLPLFIDMVLIENIVDACESCAHSGELLDYEDIKEAADCLVNDIPFVGFLD